MRTNVPALVERLFRTEAGNLIPRLTRVLGAERLALAEDAVQEAFLAALGHWPRTGTPSDPSAWLLQVARRKALDAVRREQTGEKHQPEILAALEHSPEPDAMADDALADDQLRMIFLCVHPAISAESRVALTLKTVSGLSVAEIARACLADEGAVAQRLVRAKRALRDAGARFEIPGDAELRARRDEVLAALYLMFNEGHSAHEGETLLRDELSREALRLAELVALHPMTTSAKAHALAALICLHAARFPSRTDDAGDLVLLVDQDRARWDARLSARGFQHLDAAASGGERSTYHIEAEIAAVHAAATDWQSTDWARIVDLYDELLAVTQSPVVALNRIVALKEHRGADVALSQMQALVIQSELQEYPLLHSVHAELLEGVAELTAARQSWERALAHTRAEPVRRYLQRRVARLAGLDVDSAAADPS